MMEDAMGGFALPVAVADADFLGNLSDVRPGVLQAGCKVQPNPTRGRQNASSERGVPHMIHT